MPGSTGVFRDSDDDIGGIPIQEDELLKKNWNRRNTKKGVEGLWR